MVESCLESTRIIVLAPVNYYPKAQEFALRPLMVTTVDRRGRRDRIKEVLHVVKHKAVCDLCGSDRLGRMGFRIPTILEIRDDGSIKEEHISHGFVRQGIVVQPYSNYSDL